MPRKLTAKEFINKARLIHGDKYDYNSVVYINSINKIEITCYTHGKFLQFPYHHLRGQGCPICHGNPKYTTQSFIQKSNKIHNNIYDYSKTNYKKSNIKVIIKCPIHGEFSQTPSHHLNGEICGKCESDSTRLTLLEFYDRANKIHNNFYDYSLVKYINCRTKVEIVCPKHGSFFQTPNAHLHNKRNCPNCTYHISKPEIEFLNHLNISSSNRQKYVKPYKVDAICGNIIYEFLGDFWHGNPTRFNRNDINKITKESFGKLYGDTFKKFNDLTASGYTIKYVWETDWNNFKRGVDKELKLLTY